MTLSVSEDHFPIATFSSAVFRICGASNSSLASAELFMFISIMKHKNNRRHKQNETEWPPSHLTGTYSAPPPQKKYYTKHGTRLQLFSNCLEMYRDHIM